MDLTRKIKQWLVEHCEVAADADDGAYRDALAKALVEGKLSTDQLVELRKDEGAETANALMDRFDSLGNSIGKLTDLIASQHKAETEPEIEKTVETPKEIKETKEVVTEPSTSKVAAAVAQQGGTPDEGTSDVRVKRASESYETTHKGMVFPSMTDKGAKHSLAGRPVVYLNRSLNELSQLDKAMSGAWAKFQITTSMRNMVPAAGFAMLTEHEKDLVTELCEKGLWDDSEHNRPRTRMGFPGGIKTLIDDATSGGLEAAPIVFDDDVIQTPLLHGELFPLVKVVPIGRGRRIEGVSTGTVTGDWGGVDATAIALFNTASYVSAFDTTIFRWQGSIQIGLDFMSDTPIDFGAHITAQYGQRLLEDLDDVIATGDGTTQPEGVMNKTGATSVSFSSTTSLGNYETLRFGVAKPEHGTGFANTAVFCGTETSYLRARALPVGAADARRLFGMNYDSYAIMERPYKINESLTNAQLFYAILGRYRMYRRRGLTIRTSTEGDNLIRSNELLIAVTARYGGQVERGATAAVVTDAPA